MPRWPCGVVVSAHSNEMPGSILGRDRDFRQVSSLISYVDPALFGYLDVRQLASHILGTLRRGVASSILYIQGSAQVLVIIHWPHISTASLSKGWGCIGVYLVALGLAWAEGGVGTLYKYTWSVGCCATWCNTPVPSSCCSLVVFKLLKLWYY